MTSLCRRCRPSIPIRYLVLPTVDSVVVVVVVVSAAWRTVSAFVLPTGLVPVVLLSWMSVNGSMRRGPQLDGIW